VPGSVGDPVGVGGFGGILVMIAMIVALHTEPIWRLPLGARSFVAVAGWFAGEDVTMRTGLGSCPS
jgi:hypothetical protein